MKYKTKNVLNSTFITNLPHLYDALPRSGAFEFWGGFEQLFGSNVWYQGWDFGGWLSGDVSDPASVVLAIDAGIDGPLASLTCAC